MILGLETSGRSGSAALGFPCGDVICNFTPAGESSAKMLAPAVSELLRHSKMRPSDLRAIAVTIGPGSFTGLRVGVAMAKAMAYGLRIPTIGIDTLEVLALDFLDSLQQSEQTGNFEFWTVLDAYRGEFFVAKWLSSPTASTDHSQGLRSIHVGLTCLVPTQILPQKTWYELAMTASSEIVVVGSGATKLLGIAKTEFSSVVSFSNIVPTATSVTRLAARMFRDGQVTSPIDLMPVYMRGSAAEEKKSAGKSN